MPRQARAIAPGVPHHIIFRGNNRRRIFSYPRDYLAFLRFLRAARDKTGCRICALTLLANHGHMVVVAPNGAALSQLMGVTLQRYAQRRNHRLEASGKLFEQRYKCIAVRSQAQLAATIAYVELNAERAGIAPAAFYRWTTYRLHVGQQDTTLEDLWTPSSWYLSLADTAQGRASIYADWVMLCRRSKLDGIELGADPQAAPGDHRLLRPDGHGAY